MNSLPKTVARQRRDCDLNPGPSVGDNCRRRYRLRYPRRPAQYIASVRPARNEATWRLVDIRYPSERRSHSARHMTLSVTDDAKLVRRHYRQRDCRGKCTSHVIHETPGPGAHLLFPGEQPSSEAGHVHTWHQLHALHQGLIQPPAVVNSTTWKIFHPTPLIGASERFRMRVVQICTNLIQSCS